MWVSNCWRAFSHAKASEPVGSDAFLGGGEERLVCVCLLGSHLHV
ncbi:hypothetical protein ARMA_1036 [Ardenticatena maritima]|uniref:Uncharacterized protein n=1 Tax=Ardenticatena maritima TaxID=872965 RepID=A0A0M8K674_9CHLR|nr:hypothetical protein ARMA_1036 [Ardenticatena maritima]